MLHTFFSSKNCGWGYVLGSHRHSCHAPMKPCPFLNSHLNFSNRTLDGK